MPKEAVRFSNVWNEINSKQPPLRYVPLQSHFNVLRNLIIKTNEADPNCNTTAGDGSSSQKEEGCRDVPFLKMSEASSSDAFAESNSTLSKLDSNRIFEEYEHAETQGIKTFAMLKDFVAAALKKKAELSDECKEKVESRISEFTFLTKELAELVKQERTDEHVPTISNMDETIVLKEVSDQENVMDKIDIAVSDDESNHNLGERDVIMVSHRTKLKAQLDVLCAKVQADLHGSNFGLSEASSSGRSQSSTATEIVKESHPTPVNTEENESVIEKLETSQKIAERLALDNRQLEEARYEVQEALLSKECEAEALLRKIEGLRAEMSVLQTENARLLMQVNLKEKNDTLNVDYENQSELENNFSLMAEEIERLKNELSSLHTERQELMITRQSAKTILMHNSYAEGKADSSQLNPEALPDSVLTILETDYSSALEKIRTLTDEKMEMNERLEELILQNQSLTDKECYWMEKVDELTNFQDQALEKIQRADNILKERKQAEDAIEDLKSMLGDRFIESDEYRKKYLQAQERVEELSTDLGIRQIQLQMLRESSAAEIAEIKSRCNEKIEHLEHLPQLVTSLQQQLRESKNVVASNESSIEAMRKELSVLVDSRRKVERTLKIERKGRQMNPSEREKYLRRISDVEAVAANLKSDNTNLMSQLARLDESSKLWERRFSEKMVEIADLTQRMEESRLEADMKLARFKERADSSRRALQVQVAEMEREVAVTRAAEKRAQRDKDEVLAKAQSQVENMTHALEESRARWSELQLHLSSCRHLIQDENSPALFGRLSELILQSNTKKSFRCPYEINITNDY